MELLLLLLHKRNFTTVRNHRDVYVFGDGDFSGVLLCTDHDHSSSVPPLIPWHDRGTYNT